MGIHITEVIGPHCDLDRLRSYVQLRTPQQMWKEAELASVNPNHVLNCADKLHMFLNAEDHAIALYAGALRQIEANPRLAEADTNVMGAWVNLFMALSWRGRTNAAIQAYAKATELGFRDPQARLLVATHLHALGRFTEALNMLDTVLGTSEEASVPPSMKTVAQQRRVELVRKIRSR